MRSKQENQSQAKGKMQDKENQSFKGAFFPA